MQPQPLRNAKMTGKWRVNYCQKTIDDLHKLIQQHDPQWIMQHAKQLVAPVPITVVYVNWYDGRQAIYLRGTDLRNILSMDTDTLPYPRMIDGEVYYSTTNLARQSLPVTFLHWLQNLNRLKEGKTND